MQKERPTPAIFRYLIKEKRTFSLLAADILVLTGAIFLNWNPARMAGFYYLDVCFCVLSFVIYNIFIRSISDFSSVLMATGGLFAILYFFFISLIDISSELGFGNYSKKPLELFSPYYDVGVFIICSGTAHVFNVGKYLSYSSAVAKPAFSLYLGLMLLLVPGLMVLTLLLLLFQLPLKISLILSLILIRQFIEYKRYRSFIEIESEVKRITS